MPRGAHTKHPDSVPSLQQTITPFLPGGSQFTTLVSKQLFVRPVAVWMKTHKGEQVRNKHVMFSGVLSLSMLQLKPKILVCKMAALMINVAAERRKHKKKETEKSF